MEPINIILYNKTQKVWERLTNINHKLTTESIDLSDDERPNHMWWKRAFPHMNNDPPIPQFVSQTIAGQD